MSLLNASLLMGPAGSGAGAGRQGWGLEFFKAVFLGNTLEVWLTGLGIALAVLFGLYIVRAVITNRLSKWAAKTDTHLDDAVIYLAKRTRFLFLLLVSLYCGSLTLKFQAPAPDIIRKIAVLAVLLQGAFWANALISYWLNRYKEKSADTDPASITSMAALEWVGRIGLWALILLLALDNLGIDITALITGLGISGVAVALAVQNVLKDLLASLSIILDKPFLVGDFIIVGDYMGTVEHVGIRTTRVKSLTGEQLVFSNTDLVSSRIRNYKRMQERRILFSVGVTYDTPHDKLKRIPDIIREVMASQENARIDRTNFKEFGAFSLNFETVYYVKVPDYNVYMDTQEAVNLALFKRFEEEGIEFAFPSQTIYGYDMGKGPGTENNTAVSSGRKGQRAPETSS
jgi:small-conductance mechanosensitive channel